MQLKSNGLCKNAAVMTSVWKKGSKCTSVISPPSLKLLCTLLPPLLSSSLLLLSPAATVPSFSLLLHRLAELPVPHLLPLV